ncbi:MAG: nucleotidyltransferase domain-containing protein [Candidatus Woesearchaeota archaeon]
MVQNRNIDLEVLLVLVRGASHLREIARVLNESHSTVFRRIKELVRETVLDFRWEGRNKVFFIKNNLRAKNCVFSAEIYRLSRLLGKYPELAIILEDIKKAVPKGMIVLFGSYAKGNARADSDIDIYVETDSPDIKARLKTLHSRLSIKTGVFDKDSLLIREIIRNHIIVRGVEDYYEKIGFFKET